MMRKTAYFLIACLLVSSSFGLVSADSSKDIPENVQATGVHDSLAAALAHVNLITALSAEGPFTVFAPTDAAFTAAGIDLSTFDTDEENQTLADILQYHVYAGSVDAASVTDGMTATMLNGDVATFTVSDGNVMIGDANVTTADVLASNGIIHVIDKVLMPPADLDDIPTIATNSGVHDALVAALAHANLVSVLQGEGPFTVFAPTDTAFQDAGIDLSTFDTDEENATLADILTYHVLSGNVASSAVTDGLTVTMLNGDDASFSVTDGTVKINDATVTTADVTASNGVIHIIDTVLLPPADLADIPGVAQSTGVHTALVAALSQANLVSTLQGEGPFTVFAPTDTAFQDAGIDLNNYNTDEEIAALADILTYHVLSGAVQSSTVTDGLTVTMLNGDDASFTVSGGSVMINDATVTSADVSASNGVIHVIDKVLMPPADLVDIPSVAQSTGVHTALVAALTQAGLVSTLQGDGPFTVFAPTDTAFQDAGIDLSTFDTDEENATLVDILTYHVLSGAVASSSVTDGLTVTMLNGDDASFTITEGVVKIGDAQVTLADVQASNGVVHVIDKVLMPPADPLNIPETAQGTGVHDSLVAALAKANLVDALSADGPFTVFAPSDDAFTAAGINLDDYSTEDEIAALANILTYHVYSGSVESSAVTDGLTVTMLNGDELTFSVSEGVVMAGDATVTSADVMTSNGIIHVIDKVLLPPVQEVDPFEGVNCAVTIGVGASGLAYSIPAATIDVGETVCWSWTDESMAHNVKEISGPGSTTYVENGITSGESMKTVYFHHTFDEETTFYYACEPHLSAGMVGQVVVGDGVAGEQTQEPSEPVEEDEENSPGFMFFTSIIAMLGAIAFIGLRTKDE